MIKKVISSLLLFVMVTPSLVGHAMTITGLKPVNNMTGMDYKINNDKLEAIGNRVGSLTDALEIFNRDAEQDLKNLDTTSSYIYSNNIMSRDTGFKIIDGVVFADSSEKVDPNSYFTKSGFVMALAKATYGIQESRPVIFKGKAVRDGKPVGVESKKPSWYEGEETTFDYSSGDKYLYITPSVYEMYFKQLLDKGVFKPEDFVDDFKKEYLDYGKGGKYPAWSPKHGDSNLEPNSLGRGYIVGEAGVTPVLPKLFKDERITTADALEIIEAFMRISEKDMTKLEAELINYKYGASYLTSLKGSIRDTVMFLVAKGILNFENEKEFSQLYFELQTELAYTLLYRVHNKNARLDFSQLQLTDVDNYWLARNIHKTDLELIKGLPSSTDTDIALYKAEEKKGGAGVPGALSGLTGLLPSPRAPVNQGGSGQITPPPATTPPGGTPLPMPGNGTGSQLPSGVITTPTSPQPNPSGGGQAPTTGTTVTSLKPSYKITRTFYNIGKIKYMYRGKELATMTAGSEDSVKSVDVDTANNKMVVEFVISANSEVGALALLDLNIKCDGPNVSHMNSAEAVSSVTNEGGQVTHYISQSTLQTVDRGIAVIQDKYLVNTETGARAILLENNKTALVGNEVIKTSQNTVVGMNGEVYYNLEILARLFSNAYLDELDKKSIFISDIILNQENLSDVFSEDTKANMGKTYTARFEDVVMENDIKTTKEAINITHLTNGLNFVIRDVSSEVYDGKDSQGNKVIMVLDWQYFLPTKSVDSNIANGMHNLDDPNPDMKAMQDFFFTAPSDEGLRQWWDSNVGASNGLLNFVYGTKGVNYMKSGYLAPSIRFLATDANFDLEASEALFKKMEFDSDFLNKFCGGTKDLRNYIFSRSPVEGIIHRDLTSMRSLEIEHSSKGTDYKYGFRNFILTNNNNLYMLEDFKYGINVEHSQKKVFIDSRNNEHITEFKNYLAVGGVYNFNKTDWVFEGITDSGYFALRTKDPVPVTIENGVPKFNKGGNYVNLQEWLDEYDKVADVKVASVTKEGLANNSPNGDKTYGTWSPVDNPYLVKEDKQLIFSSNNGGKILEFDKKGPNCKVTVEHAPTSSGLASLIAGSGNPTGGSTVTPGTSAGKAISSYPTIYMKRDSFVLKNNSNELVAGKSPMMFQHQNLFEGGINGSLIDSIVAMNSGYKSLDKLQDGDKVIIGDGEFICENGYLRSKPIYDPNMLTVLANLKQNAAAQKSFAMKFFDGMGINFIVDGSVRNVYAIGRHIQTARLGPLPEGIKGDKTVVGRGDGKLYLQNGDKVKALTNGDAVSSFCVEYKFDENIMFREMEGHKGTYMLVQTVNKFSNGYIKDLPYFMESLDYNDTMDDLFAITLTEYQPLGDIEAIIKEFQDDFHAMFVEGSKGMISMWTVLIILAIVCMHTALWILKKFEILTVLFRDIRDHKGKGAPGPDLLKWFSFGLVSIDEDASTFLKMFSINILLLCVAAIIVAWG